MKIHTIQIQNTITRHLARKLTAGPVLSCLPSQLPVKPVLPSMLLQIQKKNMNTNTYKTNTHKKHSYKTSCSYKTSWQVNSWFCLAYHLNTNIYINTNTNAKQIWWKSCRQVNCWFCQSYLACDSNKGAFIDKIQQI